MTEDRHTKEKFYTRSNKYSQMVISVHKTFVVAYLSYCNFNSDILLIAPDINKIDVRNVLISDWLLFKTRPRYRGQEKIM